MAGEQRKLQSRYNELEKELALKVLDLDRKNLELEIEASLDRVRAKAMAMHSSEDLSQTVNAFFKELKTLGITPIRCGVGQIDAATRTTSLTTTTSFRQGDSFDVIGKLKQTGHPVLDGIYDHWVLQQEYHPVLRGPDIKAYYDVTKSQIAYPDYSEEVTQYGNNFYFKEGFVFAWTENELSEEELKVFRRFTSVLSLTYRRYIDLKEAEAQARESQIQLALERVRAKTMAMQKSDELLETSQVLFQQLRGLGETADQLSIAIVNEEEKVFDLFATVYGAPMVRMVKISFDEPFTMGKVYKNWKANKKSFAVEIAGEELRKYNIARNANSDNNYYNEDVGVEDRWIINAASFSKGVLSFSSSKEPTVEATQLLERFAGVFESTFTRFLDLQKAEAQAREAQIETALEKVRSRSMAMQKSDELKEVIQVIYDQFVHLNIGIEHAGFVVDYKPGGDWHFWVADHLGSPAEITVANFDSAWNNGFNEAKEKGIDFFAINLSFDEKNKFYRDLFNHAAGEMPERTKDLIFSKPGLAVSTVLLETVGLYIENFTGTPYIDEENATLMRFGKVFQQTYTRFLDLQKAEAQARESQIETALEKVRSRSLAMHKSDELQDVVMVVFEKLKELGLPFDSALIIEYLEGSKDTIQWVATGDGSYSRSIYVPYFGNPILSDSFDALESGKDFFAKSYTFEEKNAFWGEAFKNTDYKYVPEERKAFILDNQKFGLDNAISKNSSICLVSFSGQVLSEQEIELLKRLSRVFEQAYVRFLDLKKAEAQAREARIEASLERVRSRAMAMHKTDELLDAAELLYKELTGLGITSMAVTYSLMDKEEKNGLYYSINPVDGKVNPIPLAIPHTETKVMRSILASWKKKETSHLIELDEKATLNHQTWVGEFIVANFKRLNINIPFSVEAFLEVSPKKAVIYTFNFAQGYIFIIGSTRLTGMQEEIVLRFTKVFELTYRRFLDLKQAEEQARESRVQLALERVRARTMAMQHSDELSETVFILFQQFKELGENPDQATIGIINEEERVIEYWVTMHGNQTNRVFKFSMDEKDVTLKIYKGWKAQKKSIVIDLSGKALHDFTAYRARMGGAPAKKGEKRRIINVAFFSKGLINVQSNEERSGESLRLLERFAAVFDGTYTRFLDLKQAEAQARESQIQLALERVRARTMAMQKSDELTETSYVLFQQFNELGANAEQASIGIFNEEEGIVEVSGTLRGIQFPQTFTALIDEPFVMGKIYKGWKSGKKSMVIEMAGQELHNYNKYRNKVSGLQFNIKEESHTDRYVINCAFFSKGVLSSSASDNASIQTIGLLERFAAVFDGTYTRFLDLKQAEAQARDAQIELGLERVRASAMAMQNSDELSGLVSTVIGELTKLDFALSWCLITILDESSWSCRVWRANTQTDKLPQSYFLQFADYPFQKAIMKAWKERKTKWIYELKGAEKKALDKYMFTKTDYRLLPVEVQTGIKKLNPAFFSFSFGNFGGLQVGGPQQLSDANLDILSRFGKVFDMTYTRFNDLKQAEAQAREARIEAALERVRSKTMAMHNSGDIGDTVAVMFDQLVTLGVETTVRCGVAILYDTKHMEVWTASDDDGKVSLIVGRLDMTIHPMLDKMHAAWENKESNFSYELAGEDIKDYYRAIIASPDYHFQHTLESTPDRQIINVFFFPEGGLFAFTTKPFSAEATQLFKRFAGVFGLTYRRFLDLQKAETNAKESQIEAALERVRGRAMAMHNSNDLSTAASMVFTEVRKLGIIPIRCGVGLLNKDSRKGLLYSATTSNNNDALALIGWVELSGHPVLEKIYDSWLNHENYFPVLNGEQLKSYYELLLSGLQIPTIPDGTADEQQYGHFLQFPEGCLYAWAENPYNDAEIKILDRFKGVISLTFRRYIELQKSEANARDAIREASLDRVRAEIASMRTTKDLEKITPLVWNELTTLGVPFIRCGVFIVDESEELVYYYLSTPDGKALAAFRLPFNAEGIGRNVLQNWRAKQVFKIHWSEAEFTEYTKSLVRQGAVNSEENYVTAHPPTSLDLHFFPFLQGMLYVGNIASLGQDEMLLVQSLADAFSTAYARYEDFNKLEEAKQEVENTLAELKAAQTKLIQSEKMASLGELTAGIAHEIQNPLNFVNNFSEVNQEMIEELQEELRAGNIDDALAIAADIKQNEEKINHHGKRADGIVKGMLQHSRTSSGEKQLTNINVLADEFMRLSYHGLRAKDKSFNSEMVTDFDPDLPKISVIAQDIGRVLLNLFNNAFYAVSEKRKTAGSNYKPKVTIITAAENGQLVIKVKDNGNGIPDAIKDKIMQPFFTTKPTGEGTGLGLSLSYDIIVKGHGGSIAADTKEGEFTEFIVQLPIIDYKDETRY